MSPAIFCHESYSHTKMASLNVKLLEGKVRAGASIILIFVYFRGQHRLKAQKPCTEPCKIPSRVVLDKKSNALLSAIIPPLSLM